MLKVGIIGTGVIFDLNILGYLKNEKIQISSLCDKDIKKIKQKIEKFNIKDEISIYSDFKEMLNNEDLDIVEILLPHHLHVEAVMHAAKMGIKGISVQKPMALSIEEADKMIEACTQSGSILSIFENFLFAPHVVKAKELIDQNYIGEITSFRIKTIMGATGGWKIPESALEWRKDAKRLGGNPITGSPVLLDNGWHAFALGWWFLGGQIEKVLTWTGNYQGMDAPALVMWKCKDNKRNILSQYGTMEFNPMPEMEIPSNYYSTDEFIEITGTRGIIKINQGTSIGNFMSSSSFFAPLIIVQDGEIESFSDFKNDWKYSFINATNHFIEAVKSNIKPILSGDQAKEILRFNLAAIKSAELGREVFLDDLN